MFMQSSQVKNIVTHQWRIDTLILVLCCPSLVIGLLMHYQFSVAISLGIALLAVTAVLILTKPEATTFVVLFGLYANLTVVAIKSHNVPELVAGSFFLLLGIPILNYLIIRRQPLVLDHTLYLMFVYLGVLLVSSVWSGQPSQSLERILSYVLEGMILYLLIINAVKTPSILRNAIWALILAGVFMGTLSLYQEITGNYDNDFGGLAVAKESEINTGQVNQFGQDIKRRRLAGPVGSKNRYAQIMVVLLPLALYRIWAERSRLLRLAAAAACIPIISGALLTFSRGAGISIILTLLMMVFLRTIKLWQLFVIVVAGCALVLIAIPDYIYRITTAADVTELATGNPEDAGGSIRGRATENLAAVYIFLDHPILGVGPGQTNEYTTKYGNEVGYRKLEGDRRAHNMYLEELSDTGLVGFISFMSIVLYAMYQLWQTYQYWIYKRPDVAYTIVSLLLAIIAFLSTGVFLHLSYVRYYWVIIALAGSATYIYGTQRKQETAVPSTVTQ